MVPEAQLDSALHDPRLALAPDFFARMSRFEIRHNSPALQVGQKALVIAWKFSRKAMAIETGILVIFSVLAGVVVGIVAHKMEIGATVSGSVFAGLQTLAVAIQIIMYLKG